MNMHKVLFAVLGVLLMASSAQATVITGNINNWGYYADAPLLPWLSVGDGTNHVIFSWSLGVAPTGFFYGSSFHGDFPYESDVAFATGVTNIFQIADASIFSFTDGSIGPNGVGDFIVARNISTGHYGVIRIDNIQDTSWSIPDPSGGEIIYYEGNLNGTWWFQTDGTGDFSSVSSVPEPSTYLLFGVGLLVLLGYRIRHKAVK